MRIVFMGTPDFASVCLKSILESDHQVVGVVTAPDRKSGRGRKVNESAVKSLAIKEGLEIAQPEKLRDTEFHKQLKDWNAELFVVVAFRMLPEVVWDMPKKGTVNLHASLLPQFRGAAPIQRAIMAGATETGATVFRLTHKIDTGDIIDSASLSIGDEENAGSLHDRILDTGKTLLVKCLDSMGNDDYTTTSQEMGSSDVEALHEAPKLFKEDRIIKWNKSSQEIHNHIRGLSPYPSAITNIQGVEDAQIKILEGKISEELGTLDCGCIRTDNFKLMVGTENGLYEVTKVQPAGKKPMDASSFIRGLRIELKNFI
jgi:methionyl-tRNA formyltransferase